VGALLVRAGSLAALGGVLYAVAACNAVLGIEEAEPAVTEQAGLCEWGQGATLQECGVSDTCESCVGACGQQLATCLATSSCRQAIAHFRTCERDDCTDPRGGCASCLTTQSGASCLAGCASKCNKAELVDRCTLFCSCMSANCAGEFEGPDPDKACHDKCEAEEPWRTYCHLDHCELAGVLPQSDHCMHASDRKPVCMAAATDPSCTNRKLSGRACQSPSDCCSFSCTNEGTCQ
jgi:hypothetical protein